MFSAYCRSLKCNVIKVLNVIQIGSQMSLNKGPHKCKTGWVLNVTERIGFEMYGLGPRCQYRLDPKCNKV